MFVKREEEEKRVGKMALNEDDLKFTVPYNGDVFTMRHLAPFERNAVEVDITRKLGGQPREAHDPNHVALVSAYAYVDASVVKEEAPSWWKSAETCYDEDCLIVLYRGLLDFKARFRKRFTGDSSENSGKGGQS